MKMEKIKYGLQDIVGVRNSKPGRQKHYLKREYKGMNLSAVAIGHIEDGEIVYNELIEHPRIKRRLVKNGKVKI